LKAPNVKKKYPNQTAALIQDTFKQGH